VAVAIQTGMEAGLSPAASVRALVVLEKTKQPMWYGQAALGLIRNSKVCELFTIIDAVGDGDTRAVTVRCKRFDMPIPVEVSFSIGEARRAGLLSKDNWKNYPDDLLVWRTVSRTAKRYFSDVLMGLEIAEVGQDFAPVDIRPTTPPPEPDPLLTIAEVTPTVEAPPTEPQKAPAPVFGTIPVMSADAPFDDMQLKLNTDALKDNTPTLEDQLLASLVDKLEGKIVSAESGRQLEKVWKDAQEPIVSKLSGSEKHRLMKLFQQVKLNFEGGK